MNIKTISAVLLLTASTAITSVQAQDCQLNISVQAVEQTDNVPEATIDALNTRLINALATEGVTGDRAFGQFAIAGKFTHLYYDVLPGPPMQTAVHTTLTLFIGDQINGKLYASKSFELRGVGTSDQRAFINAMSAINGRNAAFEQFISSAKDKIIAYYDANYPTLLAEARRAASLKDYEKAMYITASIPTCCKGAAEAERALLNYYNLYADRAGLKLLNAAKAAWAARPDQNGAAEAMGYLLQIEPGSKAYDEAQSLVDEIKRSVKSDRDFELRDKYHDAVDLEKARIDAARQVGVAFGNNQQPITTNMNWLH